MMRDALPAKGPYVVRSTPRGYTVVCLEHVMADELRANEAEALAYGLNLEHERKRAA